MLGHSTTREFNKGVTPGKEGVPETFLVGHYCSTIGNTAITLTWTNAGLFRLPAAIVLLPSSASSAEYKHQKARPGPRRQSSHQPDDHLRQNASWTWTAARCRSSSGGETKRYATLDASAVWHRHRSRWQTNRRKGPERRFCLNVFTPWPIGHEPSQPLTHKLWLLTTSFRYEPAWPSGKALGW